MQKCQVMRWIFFVYIFIHISANMSPFGLKFSQMILHTETSKQMCNWFFLFVVLHKPTLLPSTFNFPPSHSIQPNSFFKTHNVLQNVLHYLLEQELDSNNIGMGVFLFFYFFYLLHCHVLVLAKLSPVNSCRCAVLLTISQTFCTAMVTFYTKHLKCKRGIMRHNFCLWDTKRQQKLALNTKSYTHVCIHQILWSPVLQMERFVHLVICSYKNKEFWQVQENFCFK